MKTACPTCGAEVEFRYDDSFVRVCTFCRAAVLRTDRGVESLGKTADLVDLPSPIALFTEGSYRGRPFMVVGRTQLRHHGGGTWQEWYAKLDDGRWGWLAEAQGRYYLTFEVPGATAPFEFDDATPGRAATILYDGPRQLVVNERAEAEYLAAEGEIPYRFQPGARFRMADLGDAEGRFATIDYGVVGEPGPAAVYVGRQASLAELNLTGGEHAPAVARQIASRRLACPQCDGALELRAPDAALRVGCPYCGALLDANAGVLTILRQLEPGQRGQSPVPLGATCTFEGTSLTAIGHVQRSALIDGVRYAFDEVLLHAPSLGFRWLVQSDGHWSYVQPVQPAAVGIDAGAVRYDGVKFLQYQAATLEVDRVVGEFYWKVEIGEQVWSSDYIAPPAMLSSEQTADELTWSLSSYVSAREVERAFDGVVAAGSQTGVAPNQPPILSGLGTAIGVFALGFGALFVGLNVTADERLVTRQTAAFAPAELPANPDDPLAPQLAPGSLVWFSEPFELEDGDNVAIEIETSLANSWVTVGGDLIRESSGEFEMFDQDMSYYSGYDGGESWTEGSQRGTVYLGPQVGGRYVLRLEATGPDRTPPRIDVAIRQDVFIGKFALYALIAVFAPAILLGLIGYAYERKRWSNSELAPLIYRHGGDDD